MRVTIHQPQFLPWLGYLDKIDQADVFVVLDTVQYKKNEWQNRNRIRTAQGWQWLTVPVHYTFGQKIHEVRIDEASDWRARHLRALALSYGKAPFHQAHAEGLRSLYAGSSDRLVTVNLSTIRWLLDGFGITTPLRLASEMTLREEPTDRLIDICRAVGATRYLAGAGAQAYLDLPRFEASGIALEIQGFHHPTYPQCYAPFVAGLSAVDLLLNCGDRALTRLREARSSPVSASQS